MNILIVSEGLNRKNGGNGSLLDIARIILKSGKKRLFVHTTKRRHLSYLLELLCCPFDWTVLRAKYLSSNALMGSRTSFDLIFYSPAIDRGLVKSLRQLYDGAKMVSTQAGNFPGDSGLGGYLDFIDNLDYLLFQSKKHYSDYIGLFHGHKNPQPLLAYATTNESRLDFYSMFGFFLDSNIIICCGSIQPRKNQVRIATAFAKSSAIKSKYKLVFMGPTLKKHQEYAKELHAITTRFNSIIYMGNKSIYPIYLSRAAVVICGSFDEGLPTIIREAIYYRRLICSTRIDGVIGLLNDSNSILLDSLDYENNLRLFFDNIDYYIQKTPHFVGDLEQCYHHATSEVTYSQRLTKSLGLYQ